VVSEGDFGMYVGSGVISCIVYATVYEVSGSALCDLSNLPR
jgi:hypothetical protein